MKSSAILILIASVIGTDGGGLRVDAGRLAGLRVGDRGSVFYELKVRDEVRRVDVTTAEVVSIEDDTATLRSSDAGQVRDGYRVEFSLSTDRLERRAVIPRAPDPSAELTRSLETAKSRIRVLERELESSRVSRAELERSLAAARGSSETETERLVTADEARKAAERRVRELEDRLTAARMYAGSAMADLKESRDQAEARAALLESELDAAERALAAAAETRSVEVESTEPAEVAQAELDEVVAPVEVAAPVKTAAAPIVEEVAAARPENPAEPTSEAGQTEEDGPTAEVDPTAEMVRLDPGRYAIGLPVSEANFYNQTPRFTRHVEALWLDLAPVTGVEFAAAAGAGASPPIPGSKTAVTFVEAAAYCRSVGKRLPTEVEWEAAFTSVELEGRPGLLEWTSSWYEPYPGNDRPEADYGQRFRVIRASAGSRRDRRFMSPGDRDTSVGFRCVRDGSSE